MNRPRATQRTPGAEELPGNAWRLRFRRRVLAWFDASARDVPWRPSPGLYAIWISEIMLQQTQVATVIPYYTRFLQRFPNVSALAAADEQEVLKYWEGLGYYRRARQLHAAARRVVHEHAGRIPTSLDRLRALPGIGRYTAGAILSIALDQRQPILEANTVRLLSRLLALTGDPACSASRRRLWGFAQWLLPRRRCGDFNQALMELGSLVCTPRAPACDACPVAGQCPTRARGFQDRIPPARRRPAAVAVHEAVVVMYRADGRLLVRCCEPGERWAGLWDFPRVPLSAPSDRVAREELCARITALTGGVIDRPHVLTTLRHGVTRFRITLTCFQAACRRLGPRRARWRWVSLHQLDSLPLNATARQIHRLLASRAAE